MLNELHILRKNLDEAGFDLPDRHPDVKRPGRAPGIRVGLNEKGMPSDVEALSAEAMVTLWTIREGKHNSFPVVKIKQPLLNVPSEGPIRSALDGLNAISMRSASTCCGRH